MTQLESLRHEHLYGLRYELVAGVTEQGAGGGVGEPNQASRIDHGQGVGGEFQELLCDGCDLVHSSVEGTTLASDKGLAQQFVETRRCAPVGYWGKLHGKART